MTALSSSLAAFSVRSILRSPSLSPLSTHASVAASGVVFSSRRHYAAKTAAASDDGRTPVSDFYRARTRGAGIGLVGLPNVGKSSLFNALCGRQLAEASNYPFCTIKPNTAKVSVVDHRLIRLSALAGSSKTVSAQVTFVDIAGLVRGASEGEGMGNEFLSNIRETSAIVHVVRCFENAQIQHVDGSVNSARDLDTIDSELRLADLQTLDAFIEKAEARLKRTTDPTEIKLGLSAADRFRDLLHSNLQRLAAVQALRLTADEWQQLRLLNLLTIKPQLIVCNVGENELRTAEAENPHVRAVRAVQQEQGGQEPVVLCASLEADLVDVEDPEERQELMSEYGIAESGLEAIAGRCRQLLGLHSFYTVGDSESETKMWTIPAGFTAAQAAGTIHSDFETKFIHANCVSIDEILSSGVIPAKDKWRREGRNYVCQDGDCFRFQVRK
eukprot:CAMPEP_0177649178 /NCGR_PEP_ID=MMETSP0447-20121125/11231_1 /TAXON_ID=0 /ORGANISM="Stygamoeba regulata, Strain BSH-02190019" /LENGTH=442 /DNA_ID=CAMNT_0019151885 /DNA_START=31 /DNA_END=1359 /DNA_ORIENTATION=-